MILELADWSVTEATKYKWSYSYKEILRFFNRKHKTYANRFNSACEFAVELVSAALGGKKSGEGEYELADGSEEELTEEQIANLKRCLGSNFAQIYPQYVDR